MMSSKPPIYRSNKAKHAVKLNQENSQSTLRRNLSIPNVDNFKVDVGVPSIVMERSSSLSRLGSVKNINISTKSLSASNIMALSDPNLSLQEAKPKRIYDSFLNESAQEKIEYTAYAQMYFYQLTRGCQNRNCRNKFCCSNKTCILTRFSNSEHMAVIFSTELAKKASKFLCAGCERRGRTFPKSLLEKTDSVDIPFECLLITMSPFRSLFHPCPMVSSDACDDLKDHQRSISHGNLNVGDRTQQATTVENVVSGISALTRQLSSSISRLWKPQGEEDNSNGLCSDNIDGSRCGDDRLDSRKLFGDGTYVSSNEGLEEFESSVASEMTSKSHDIQELSLTHLTLEMMEQIMRDFKKCGDSSFIVNTLRTVFSSSPSLNESFLNSTSSDSQYCDGQINMNSLHLAYQLIESCNNGEFMSTVIDSIELLLSDLEFSTMDETTGMNLFVIIMELPTFFDLNFPYTIAEIFQELRTDLRMQMIQKFSVYDSSSFRRILKGFQTLLCSCLKEKVTSDKHILSLCNVLGMLYEANCKKKIVNEEEFYNKKLSKCLDVKKEYEHWQTIIHPSKNGDACFFPRGKSIHSSIFQYPFLLQPETKVHIIHYEAINEMRKEYQAAIIHQARIQTIERVGAGATADTSSYSKDVWAAMCPYLVLEVRRDYMVTDAMSQLERKVVDLKKPLKIRYTGGGEQGLDMGGLQKEFFQLALERLFDPSEECFSVGGTFVQCPETNNVWFSTKPWLEIYEFTGLILGLAIYNGIILDVPLPRVIYAKLKNEQPTLQHLYDIEPTLARTLQELLDYEGNLEEDFCLDFQITERVGDTTTTFDLLPGASDIIVTEKNRQLYVDLYVSYLLNEKIETQFNAFATGFSKVCDGDAMGLFRADELELLICGSPQIKFTELEDVATYADGYTKSHAVIKWFWSVVDKFTHEQKKGLLSFVTGSDRVPLTGLRSISFIIQRNGPDTDNLPTSMTCFNRLLLPEYSSSRKLKEKLLISIENRKGFGLT